MPAVLYLHAISRSGDDFLNLQQRLGGDAPDLPGHGQAARASHYSLAAYADALHLTAPTLVYGHSLGGLVACVLAARQPDNVTALVLEDPPLFEIAPDRFHTGPFASGFTALHDILSAQPDQSALKQMLAAWPSGRPGLDLGTALDPADLGRRARALLNMDPDALRLPGTDAFLAGIDIPQILAELDMPVHLLCGARANGSAITDHDQKRFMRLTRHGHLHVFEDCGHDIRLFEPDVCTEIIAAAHA